MNPKIIVIDGKTYHSVNEMPPDIRQKYEQAIRSLGDENGNRIPDAFENMNILADKDRNSVPDVLENLVAGHAAVNSMKIIVDGKEFNGIENLPPEARAKYEDAMGKLDANRNGIPDFVEGMINVQGQTANDPSNFGREPARHSTPLPASPMITPETSNGWMLVLAGLFIFLVCAVSAAGIWYFFLR
jgi:hypothetical protein